MIHYRVRTLINKLNVLRYNIVFRLSLFFVVLLLVWIMNKSTTNSRLSSFANYHEDEITINELRKYVTKAPYHPLVESCEIHPRLSQRILKDLSAWPVIHNTTSEGIPLHQLKKCSMVLRIANQKLYILGKDSGSMRSKGMKVQIMSMLETHRAPNVDICVNCGDWLDDNVDNSSAPVFVMDKLEGQIHVLVPDFTFAAFPGTHTQGYELTRERVFKAAEGYPWNQRSRKVFYRGNPNASVRKKIGLLNDGETFDTFVPTTNLSPKDAFAKKVYIPLEEHCNFTYLVHAEGVFYSSKMKYLLMCGSVVFWGHSFKSRPQKYMEFWYDLLQPWVSFVPLDPENVTQAFEAVKWVKDDEQRAKDIAHRGLLIAQGTLSPWNVKCYWQRLLYEYEKRMTWKVDDYQPTLEDISTNLARGD